MKIQPIRRFSPAFHAALEAVRNAAPVNRTENDNAAPWWIDGNGERS